jgi:hypothetical protein
MGPSRFTSHPKEGVLRIFIALKNPSPRPGLNPRSLGPVASTLATTPPIRLDGHLNTLLREQSATYRNNKQDATMECPTAMLA